MAMTNHERIGRALNLLSEGLAPFVARECEAKYGTAWAEKVIEIGENQSANRKTVSPRDVQILLTVMWNEWQVVFRNVLGHSERTYVSELRTVRNRWAHQEQFTTDDADRALDTMRRLLLAVSAGEEATEVDKMRHELLRVRFSEQARHSQRKAAVFATEGQPAGGLRPWRELVTPHPDVASGRYQQAEFAADLHQVYCGEAADEYGNPVEFFRRTFLTEGLRTLLLNATRRFSKAGGDPVIELQTNFGGGKTHSMIALYHLAGGSALHELPGVEALMAESGLANVPPAKRAVLVGQMISPGTVHVRGSRQVRTLWGELAWQLGGDEGFAVVEDADATGTSPGEALVELLRQYAPCLILIDEWVAYARQLYGKDGLPAGSFDAQFTFAQALAEAARKVEGALLVVSIPASDIEVGGEGGRAALERLQNVIGRMETSWRPASAEEGFEIVRRRLFDELPAQLAPDRDAVVRAFGALYRGEKAEFPAGVSEADYERRIAAAYPIHPELFDRLYNEWSSLDKFQRTRGVLRLMAAVIHELWERNDSSLLIMPATVPIDAPRVAEELTRYLEQGWTPVIEKDVDGPNSLPLTIDRSNPNLGRYSATRRVARTIYLGSAPLQHASNRGIDDKSIKLGCVQPGEIPATFGDSLRRLTDQATFLYVDGQRYWYSLQPSVARLARDRAASHFSDDEVDEEIRRRLGGTMVSGVRGDFSRVHPAPRSFAEVPDDAEVRLVVLGPEAPHSSKTADSPARRSAAEILDKRSGGAREFRNMLIFVAADRTRLDELRDAVRDFLAWKSIDDEKGSHNFGSFELKQIETKRKQLDDLASQRVGETFVWVLEPTQKDASDPTVSWSETRVNGPDPIAVRISKKLRSTESLITEYSGTRLRLDLDRVPLWRGDSVSVKQLWQDYAKYLYLSRLRHSTVLLDAIRAGVGLLSWSTDTFAYAEGYEEDAQRFTGLVAAELPTVLLDASSLLVKPEPATAQLDRERAGTTADSTEPPLSDLPVVNGAHGSADLFNQEGLPRRFYGRVNLDPVRVLRDVGHIVDEVITQLQRAGADMTISMEIDAHAPGGFPEDIQRFVQETVKTLKFDEKGFESE